MDCTNVLLLGKTLIGWNNLMGICFPRICTSSQRNNGNCRLAQLIVISHECKDLPCQQGYAVKRLHNTQQAGDKANFSTNQDPASLYAILVTRPLAIGRIACPKLNAHNLIYWSDSSTLVIRFPHP